MTPWVTPCAPNSFWISLHFVLHSEAVGAQCTTAYALEAGQGGHNAYLATRAGHCSRWGQFWCQCLSELIEQLIACYCGIKKGHTKAHTKAHTKGHNIGPGHTKDHSIGSHPGSQYGATPRITLLGHTKGHPKGQTTYQASPLLHHARPGANTVFTPMCHFAQTKVVCKPRFRQGQWV